MTLTRKQARRLPPSGGSDRETAEAINNIFNGRLDAVGEVTLTPGAITTTVEDTRCTSGSVVCLESMTANAAAERAAGSLYVVPGQGSFTVNHANNAQTDRTFRYVVLT